MPSDSKWDEAAREPTQDLATARTMLADDADPGDRLPLAGQAYARREDLEEPIWGVYTKADEEPLPLIYLNTSEFASTEAILEFIDQHTRSFSREEP